MPNMGETIALIKALGGSGGAGTITDVQVNGTSVVTDGVANVPLADLLTVGAFKTALYQGFNYDNVNGFKVDGAITDSLIKGGEYTYKYTPISAQHQSTFYGLAKAAGADMKDIASTTVGVYPAAQKSAISTMLNAPETVTGTTPTITAMAGVQYVCGEVSTLDITLPASGCVDIRFESGSTPTVLTITPPTGVAVKWAGGFDPTALEANTVYEINIADGLGVAASWT